MSLHATTSQTVGPYLHIGMTWLIVEDLGFDSGERVRIEGRIVDGEGAPVNDALVEIWQADAKGAYDAKGRRGFGRSATDADGKFRFNTVKPGRVTGQAPHIAVNIFMRGQLKQLVSRIYFPDESSNAGDAVLALVPEERRATLLAKRLKPGVLGWNVFLQGTEETVFFDL